ncbi:hypothetical protein AMS68_001046 [Peltaster fructicola]|uniref:Uncharacterized protein n=1 Tax=Peltaster fructicola TaxID=286661 RepID=A0A6H0XLM8_9PEZI|nr:hypothetical protein AMS68_001046 [Peltaster fructicola]
MSQDLFAAFGDFEPPAKAHYDTTQPTQPDLSNPGKTPAHTQTVDDDDDFGDFEDAANVPPQVSSIHSKPVHKDQHRTTAMIPPTQAANHTKGSRLPFSNKSDTAKGSHPSTGRHPFADHMDILFSADDDEYNAGQDEWNDLSNNPEAAMAYSKQVIQQQLNAETRTREQSTANKTASEVPSTPPAQAQAKVPVKSRNPDVLFDADNLSDVDTPEDDDWGDFEDVGASAEPKSTLKHEMAAPADLLGLEDPVSAVSKHTLAKTHSRIPSRTKNSPLPALPRNDEPWDDFNMISPQAPSQGGNIIVPITAKPKAQTLSLPPTNIPPPSLILSLVCVQLKQEAVADAVPGLITSSWVAAHVLAGRKLRWKRSTTLAASMRIGPAAAGGKSGMKLTGVDRGEVAKEDREVAELLSTWRARVGKLRSALVSYNTASVSHKALVQRLPELSEAMPIKILMPVEGGFQAPHECALCGMKREERIARVDDNVDDSFGEWWIENASMHNICAEWWLEHELDLRSR